MDPATVAHLHRLLRLRLVGVRYLSVRTWMWARVTLRESQARFSTRKSSISRESKSLRWSVCALQIGRRVPLKGPEIRKVIELRRDRLDLGTFVDHFVLAVAGQLRERPNKRVHTVRRFRGHRHVIAHLVFEHAEGANVMNTVLLVECSNRFRAPQFAARGVYGLVSKGVIDVAENRFDQVAAVIDLSNDAIRFVGLVCADHKLCSIVCRIATAEIVKHVVVGRPLLTRWRYTFRDADNAPLR